MGFLAQIIRPQAASRSPTDPFWFSGPILPSTSGVTVTPEVAVKISAVWQGIRILSEALAMLPLMVYRRVDDGKAEARQHPLFSVLHDQPNRLQNSFMFRELMMVNAVLRGASFAEIIPGRRGAVDQLLPLSPDRVEILQADDGQNVEFRYRPQNQPPRTLRQDQVFYLEGPFNGKSLLRAFRDSVGIATAADGFAAALFKNAARIPLVIKHKDQLSDLGRFAESFAQSYGGYNNAGKTPILEEDMQIEKIGMTAEDAQTIASREFQVIEFARWLNIPPHRLAVKVTQPRANMEQEAIEFVEYTMLPWLRRWEHAINTQLIAQPQTFFAEFTVEGILRGDSTARAQFYKTMIELGIMTRNEVRKRENLNVLPGLDSPLTPLNMGTVQARYEQVVRTHARSLVTKELNALRRIYKKTVRENNDYDAFTVQMNEFYAGFTQDVARYFAVSQDRAEAFTRRRLEALKAKMQQERVEIASVLNLLTDWEKNTVDEIDAMVREDLEDAIRENHSGGETNAVGDSAAETLLNS